MLYFAYGSNLNEDRIKERCPSAEFLYKAYLTGYELSFMENNSEKIVANIVQKKGSSVIGAVIHIAEDADIKSLDRAEGHPVVYKRTKVRVLAELKKDFVGEIEVETYIMDTVYPVFEKRSKSCFVKVLHDRLNGIPKPEYLQHIVKGYNCLGFDVKALEKSIKKGVQNER